MAVGKLFLVRHGQPEELGVNKRLNDAGRAGLEPTIQTIKNIFEREKISRQDVSLVSSNQRRAIDTVLFIGDSLSVGKELVIDINLFQPYLFGFEKFYNSLENPDIFGLSDVVLAVAHREIIEFFPKLLAKKQREWGKFEYNGMEYGNGYYFDFEKKSYELIPY